MVVNTLNFGHFSLWIFGLLATIHAIIHVGAQSVESDQTKDHKNISHPFDLEDIYYDRFHVNLFNGTWISSNEIYYEDSDVNDVLIYNVETRQTTVVLSGGALSKYNFDYTCILSPDRTHVLIGYSPRTKYRYSTYRKYDILNVKTFKVDNLANGQEILLATWGPVGHSLVYETNNDLYYREEGSNGKGVITRLTHDGVAGVIYNGLTDWVYEEEVMASDRAVWFSPNGRYLAFASLNDTEVQIVSELYYGKPGSLEYQYPEKKDIRYPKAGTKNPDVSLNIVDLKAADGKIVHLKAPTEVVSNDHILFTVNWLTNESVLAIWMNRVQNVGELVAYDVKSGNSTNLLTLKEDKGWLEVPQVILHAEGKIFFQKYQPSSSGGKWNHVTSYDLTKNDNLLTNETDLSPFPYAVQSLLAINSERRTIYYLASVPRRHHRKHLYSTSIAGGESPVCLSCSLVTPEGNNCTYVTAEFSTDASYYSLACTGPDPAVVGIYSVRENKQILTWEANELLRDKLKDRMVTKSKIVHARLNGYKATAKMILPAGFDENRKYPMIVEVYAGPNTAAISDSLSFSWHSYYTTNRSVIWTVIDGRGSAYRGSDVLFSIYRGLGTVEVEDQISMTSWLQSSFPWIDANRTGIWGWSYGGFATAMALATDTNNVFKCGISVAPVSSWIYYDSIYTERFMGLPTVEDNLAGYNRSDVTRLVDGIRGKKYLFMHGTGDDNVHYQQSMALARSLENADIQFEQISYTDERHGLEFVTPHLAHTMDRFWDECLELPRT